jgi:hypothetical protein
MVLIKNIIIISLLCKFNYNFLITNILIYYKYSNILLEQSKLVTSTNRLNNFI